MKKEKPKDKEREEKKNGTIFIISDGTGETASLIVKAALVQYEYDHMEIVRHTNIRTTKQIESLLEKVDPDNTLITYTIILEELRKDIQHLCQSKKLLFIDLLKPLIHTFDKLLVRKQEVKAGILHQADEEYFKRIDAVEFSLKYDDGSMTKNLHLADIVLVGVSRTSKTPLSIFLSYKGYKVANIPFIKDIALPQKLFEIDQKKVIALTIDSENLLRIRRNRLQKIGVTNRGDYADKLYVYQELEQSRTCYEKYKWPVINVTDRALEETASDILRIIQLRGS